MTKTNMDLTEFRQKHDQGDLLRSIAEAVLQLMMESDVDGLVGAGRHERAEQRTTWRNGYCDRSLDTRLETLNLKVPKLRQGSYFPSFIEARETSEQALVAVIQEAWIGGVSIHDRIRSGLTGEDVKIDDPYGDRPLIYADYVASGRSLAQIEDLIRDQVLPTMPIRIRRPRSVADT